jgi:NADH-quinone oxidoreductase subunit K
MIPLNWYLLLSALLFCIGLVGVLIKRNVIMVFLCLELMLNAANLSLVAFSKYLGNMQGQIFSIFNITVAAAEAVVGLAIVISLYRTHGTTNVDEFNILKW